MGILHLFLCSTVMGIVAHAQNDLTTVHFPPLAIELSPLTGIAEMNYRNVSALLSTLLEAYQRITAFKNELVSTRLSGPIPPPHEHCFISERDLSRFTPENVTHNLMCDQHLLNLLSLALERVARFEKSYNPNSEYYRVILVAKSAIESISRALTNITRDYTGGRQDTVCGLPSLSALSSSNGQQQPNNSLEVGAPEDRSRQSRRRGQVTVSPTLPPTPPPRTVPPSATEPVGDSDPTDDSFYNMVLLHKRQANNPEEQDATPTAVTRTRCGNLDNVNDQFIYIYEVWLGLYYVQIDLTQKKKCLQ